MNSRFRYWPVEATTARKRLTPLNSVRTCSRTMVGTLLVRTSVLTLARPSASLSATSRSVRPRGATSAPPFFSASSFVA